MTERMGWPERRLHLRYLAESYRLTMGNLARQVGRYHLTMGRLAREALKGNPNP